MTTESQNSEEKTPEVVAAENKPFLQSQIDFIEDNIKAANHDLEVNADDDESTQKEKDAFAVRLQEQLAYLTAIKENLIAVKIWNLANERGGDEHITDKNKVGVLLASNIDSQIVYLDAYIMQLRKDAMHDFKPWMETDMIYQTHILNTLKMTKWFVKSITDELTSMPGNQPTNINEELTELVSALKEAKETIRSLHGIGMPDTEEEKIWKIYNGNAPEMKRLNSVLEKYVEEDMSHE
jgi:hypothetical protein